MFITHCSYCFFFSSSCMFSVASRMFVRGGMRIKNLHIKKGTFKATTPKTISSNISSCTILDVWGRTTYISLAPHHSPLKLFVLSLMVKVLLPVACQFAYSWLRYSKTDDIMDLLLLLMLQHRRLPCQVIYMWKWKYSCLAGPLGHRPKYTRAHKRYKCK